MSVQRPRLVPSALLWLARHLPRGSWPIVRYAAARDAALSDYTVRLRGWPEREFHLDLREPVFHMYFRDGCIPHQEAEDRVLEHVLHDGDCVFDVGANVGYLTVMFSRWVGPSGQVVAFEPSPRTAAFLERNLEDGDRVRVCRKAVGSSCGTVVFHESESLNISRVGEEVTGRWPTARSYSVESVTLDSFLESGDEPPPDLLKVDVEGFEAEVFAGARNLLSSARPLVLFEGLSGSELERSLQEIENAGAGIYRFARIARDASLVPLEREEGITNNFLAIPARMEDRIDGLVDHSRS